MSGSARGRDSPQEGESRCPKPFAWHPLGRWPGGLPFVGRPHHCGGLGRKLPVRRPPHDVSVRRFFLDWMDVDYEYAKWCNCGASIRSSTERPASSRSMKVSSTAVEPKLWSSVAGPLKSPSAAPRPTGCRFSQRKSAVVRAQGERRSGCRSRTSICGAENHAAWGSMLCAMPESIKAASGPVARCWPSSLSVWWSPR